MRGEYGVPDAPPDPSAPPKRSRWWTVAIVAGVAGVAYFFVWPRIRPKQALLTAPPEQPPAGVEHIQHVHHHYPPAAPATAPAPAPAESPQPPPPESVVPFLSTTLEREAAARGFSSVADYEDSVLRNARQVRGSGSAVTLAPHLAHLASRLYGG